MSHSVRDKILAILAISPCSKRYFHRSFIFHYHQDSIYKAVRALKNQNLIEFYVEDGSEYLRFTEKGRGVVENTIPVFNQFNKLWDGYWRLFIFDVPERKRHRRDYLRKKLKRLGFGLWQRSVWISPFNVEEKLINIFDEKPHYSIHVDILKAKRVWEGGDKFLADQVWQLRNINNKYKRLRHDWEEAFEKFEADFISLKKIAATLQHRYTDLLLEDPGLPEDLLPVDWCLDGVQDLFLEWRAILETHN